MILKALLALGNIFTTRHSTVWLQKKCYALCLGILPHDLFTGYSVMAFVTNNVSPLLCVDKRFISVFDA